MLPFISQLPLIQEKRWLNALNKALPDEQVVSFNDLTLVEKQQCVVAIVANPSIDSLLEFNNLVWLHSVWAGVEHLMLSLADSPIDVVRLIDPTLAKTMAEAVLAWGYYLHRDMPRYAKQQQNKVWQQHPHVPASQRHIGILGLGELGRASAQQLQKNGFKVSGWSRTEKNIANITTYNGEQGLLDMVSELDILVCLLPLTPATLGLVNHQVLAQLPKSASIINFARGGIIDTADLLLALNNGHISHAVLDVFEQEPLPQESALWRHPNITILPHISAPTNLDSACDIVAKNIQQFRKTGQVPNAVNKENGY